MLYNNRLYPDMPRFLKMLERAENKKAEARDVRELMTLCMMIRKRNLKLRGHISVRKTAISSFNWEIVADKESDQARADQATLRLKKLINTLIKRHTQTPLFGVSVAGLRVENTSDGNVLMLDRWYDPDEIEKYGDDVYLLEETGTGFKRIAPKDRHSLVLIDASEDDNSGGIMSVIAIFEILANEALRDWTNFNRKLEGIIHATYDPEKLVYDEANQLGKSDISTAHEAIKSAQRNKSVATSNAVEIALRELTTAGGYNSFKEFLERIEAAQATAILGQANTTQLPANGGSRAALQVLNYLRMDIHYDDMQRIEERMGELLLMEFQQNTNSNATSVPYVFRFTIEEEQDTEAAARTVEILQAAGYELNEEEVSRKTGFTVKRVAAVA